MINVIELLENAGFKPSKVSISATKGAEYHSACPGCGGRDRFHVWPEQNNNAGSYWCRSCEKQGDNIQYLRDFEGLSWPDACRKCGREDMLNQESVKPANLRQPKPLTMPPADKNRPAFTPNNYQPPPDVWIEQAEAFSATCEQAILENKPVLSWLASRGLPLDAVRRFRLGWNAGREGKDLYKSRKSWDLPEIKKDNGRPKLLWLPIGLTIPCFDESGRIIRIRFRRTKEAIANFGEKYPVIAGSCMRTMVINPAAKAFVVVEAELDAMACAHATGDQVGAVSVLTVEGKPDIHAMTSLTKSLAILNALDIGDTGGGKVAGDRAKKWWLSHFPDTCEIWPVAVGKDPGEAAQAGEDLRLWVLAGLPPVFSVEAPGGLAIFTGLDEKAAAEKEIPRVEKPESSTATVGANLVSAQSDSDLAELHAILKSSRATIVKDGLGGLHLDFDRTTAKPDQIGRLSALAFISESCGLYIDRHPADRIHHRNFFFEVTAR